MTTPSPEALQTREQMLNDLRMERAAGNIPAPTPTSGEVVQGEALAKALCLLDSFAGEGLAHTYGNCQTLDAAEVCSELANAVGVECEPGWWRTVGRLAFSRPELVGDEALVERVAGLEWPAGERFTFHDDPGEHEPCYVVMPGGGAIPLNHHDRNGVDQARARFIVNACNAALFPRAALQAIPAPATDAGQSADSLVEAAKGAVRWLEAIDRCDMGEIVADGGITAGMVVQQEARTQASRLRASLPKSPSAGEEA
jgi:hypothetical protein